MDYSEAACRPKADGTQFTALFFSPYESDKREAKAICESCPQRENCFERAVIVGEEFGIWGGREVRDIRMARRKRGLRLNPGPRPL